MKENNTNVFGAVIVLLICSLIKNLFLNLFLAFTTVFPFILILNYVGTPHQSTKALESYQFFLSSIISFLLHKTLDTVSTGELITLFFLVMFVISMIISGIRYLLKTYLNISFKIKIIHIIIFMTVVYSIGTLLTYIKDPANVWFLGIFTFYLFNVFSVFSYKKITEEMRKLRSEYPKLNRFPF